MAEWARWRRRVHRSRRGTAALALALLLGGCAPTMTGAGVGASGSPAHPPTEAVLSAHATLLRLEDRREFDAATLRSLAADSSPRVRARTALALARLRDAAGSDLLLHLLTDPDTAVAANAAFGLGQLADSAHAPALAAILTEPDLRPTVAAEAAYALGKVGGMEARAALVTLLEGTPLTAEPAHLPVHSGLLAIWKLPPLEDLAPIARWLEATHPELRWRAAYALTRRPNAAALPRLRPLLADANPAVRAVAVRGMTGALADSAGIIRESLAADIVPLTADTAYPVSINAIRSLGTLATPTSVAQLAELARGGEPHRAWAALEALGASGDAAAGSAPQLAETARADSVPVAIRSAALDALTAIHPPTATATAQQLAAHPEWRLRASAARAFARSAGHTSTQLIHLVRDADGRVASAALRAAIEAAGDDQLATLRPLLIEQLGASDVSVRTAALEGLAQLPDPALLPLFLEGYERALGDDINDAALAAINALGALRGHGIVPERTFLTRFDRPADPLLRLRAVARLDSAAVVAQWGDRLPIEGGSPGDYRRFIEEWVAPALRGEPQPEVELVTNGDTMRIRLFVVDAPLTAHNLLTLAAVEYFDEQRWPRVVPNFVVQGGDPRGDTSGGPGYSIRDEINRHRYGTGTVGMALAGPDTGGSQFFITHSPQPHLDGGYTIFGEVLEGQAITHRILPGDVIESIRRVR